MPFERPTLAALVDRITTDIQTRITGATTLLRRSTLKVLAKVHAGAIHLLYGFLDYQSQQLFAIRADEEGLKDHGTEWGIDRTDTNKATGNAAVTGTTGTVIPAGTELQSTDGNIYVTNTVVTIAEGVGTIALTAQTANADSNDDGGITLSFVSPITDIDDTATVDSSGLDGGLDIEDVEDWRERILLRKRQPPHGGALHDYIAWMLEVAGVTRAWSFSLYQGLGTIGATFVRDNDDDLIPSATVRATVRAYIIKHEDPTTGITVGIPVTAEPGLFMIELTKLTVTPEFDIYPNTVIIQANITEIFNDAILAAGGPGETVYISDLYFALSGATGLQRLRIDAPAADVTALQTEVHVPGTPVYGDY